MERTRRDKTGTEFDTLLTKTSGDGIHTPVDKQVIVNNVDPGSVTLANGTVDRTSILNMPGSETGPLDLPNSYSLTALNETAVKVRNAIKCYGEKRILRSLNMTVPKGTIAPEYALLHKQTALIKYSIDMKVHKNDCLARPWNMEAYYNRDKTQQQNNHQIIPNKL